MRSIIYSALLAIIVLVALLVSPVRADSHGSGTPEECAQYGCLYGHDRTVHTRTGPRTTTEYGVAHDRLPDGPDGRYYVTVLWPMVSDTYRYDPGRRALWDRVAHCESTNRWGINTGNGYHGGLQFHPNTWNAYGGGEYARYAYQATPEQQIAVAERVLWAGHDRFGPQGKGAWPHCGRGLVNP